MSFFRQAPPGYLAHELDERGLSVPAVELDDHIADVEAEVVAVETLAGQRLINVGKCSDEVVEIIMIGLDLPREAIRLHHSVFDRLPRLRQQVGYRSRRGTDIG